MSRFTKRVLGLGAVLMGLAGAWAVLSPTVHPAQVERRKAPEIRGSAPLDGKTFAGELGPVGKPADVKDTLTFANGTFVSIECDRRCGYPPTPYFVRRVGDKIEFVAESQCLHKDATLVWRGIVDGKTMKGRLSWRANRWYWTIEKEFWFEGKLVEAVSRVPNNE